MSFSRVRSVFAKWLHARCKWYDCIFLNSFFFFLISGMKSCLYLYVDNVTFVLFQVSVDLGNLQVIWNFRLKGLIWNSLKFILFEKHVKKAGVYYGWNIVSNKDYFPMQKLVNKFIIYFYHFLTLGFSLFHLRKCSFNNSFLW